MKKNIGKALALYPAPLVVVGSMVDGKPNWTLVAHAGIMAHSHLMLSMVESHYTNRGILATKNVSVNVVDESWLKEADYMGVVSGNKTDKSGTFAYTLGEQGTPLIDKAKVSIECSVIDDYKLDGFDNFICRIENTYASETILNKAGKIDINREYVRPMPAGASFHRCRTMPRASAFSSVIDASSWQPCMRLRKSSPASTT